MEQASLLTPKPFHEFDVIPKLPSLAGRPHKADFASWQGLLRFDAAFPPDVPSNRWPAAR